MTRDEEFDLLMCQEASDRFRTGSENGAFKSGAEWAKQFLEGREKSLQSKYELAVKALKDINNRGTERGEFDSQQIAYEILEELGATSNGSHDWSR